ncbi:HI_0552 family protein [Neisseria sp. CCUG12390]|uniref:HI_0552 family protein n=1 Tax=Neisseria sp. CCUG12390 TaxID=3392035 RepID=UPI003A0FBD7D
MLTPQSSELFDIPFYQFAQMKKHAPEMIEPTKAAYKHHWQIWRELIGRVADDLGEPFAPPHIERWCNGWQVRAHFFAYFKYAQYKDSAAIISILLNRRRLTVSLDWHCYKAGVSPIALPQYNQWLDGLDAQKYAAFDIWHGAEDEYADYQTVAQTPSENICLRNEDDFFCIGKHIERKDLGRKDVQKWIAQAVEELLPLYEACFK